MADVFRQNKKSHSEECYVNLGQGKTLNMDYTSNSFPFEEDRGPDDVDESLLVQLTAPDNSSFVKRNHVFYDIIFSRKGVLGVKFLDMIPISPGLDAWMKLPTQTQEKILSKMSSEAKNLLNKGLCFYEDFRGSQ